MQIKKKFKITLQKALTLCETKCIIKSNIATRKVRREGIMSNLTKNARISAGFSLENAAKELGISAGYLSQIENGQRQVSKERAEQISTLYGKSKEEIFLASRYAIRKDNNSA